MATTGLATTGITRAVFRRIICFVATTRCSPATDCSRTLRNDYRWSGRRLRAGGFRTSGDGGTSAARTSFVAVDCRSQCGHRCTAISTQPSAARTDRGRRSTTVAGTRRHRQSGSTVCRRCASRFAATGRYNSRYRDRSSVERHDVPSNRRCHRAVGGDRSSKIRSWYSPTAKVDVRSRNDK